MYDFMIYKYDNCTDEEKNNYENKIKSFSDSIASNYYKGKKLLVITGSGISNSVPGMSEIMDKLIELINDYDGNWDKSNIFNTLVDEFLELNKKENKSLEIHQAQSKLITYVQNAYLDKNNYVQESDRDSLKFIWENLVIWLINGDEKYNGLLKAKCSEQHKAISEMYKQMNAISITTNFDNLLNKAFNKDDNFYPILDTEAFNKYFTSEYKNKDYIEIQSRGDAFWVECSGEKNKICPNRHKQCYIPGNSIKIENGNVRCSLCNSKSKIYFAFPGTKQKDDEMSAVIDGVWKYFANAISAVLIIGNSMDYDPVLVDFIYELDKKRNLPIMYISRYDDKKTSKLFEDIYEKAATRLLFKNDRSTNRVWARAVKTEEVLKDIIDSFKEKKEQYKPSTYSDENKRLMCITILEYLKKLFDENPDIENVIIRLKSNKFFDSKLLDIEVVNRMKSYSQLGLKTYWMEGKNVNYQDHNRFKHSIGVMLIASYLYLNVYKDSFENSDAYIKKSNMNDLRFLQIAALFHDIGHLPFSHMIEEIFEEFGWIPAGENKTFNHEQYSRKIIKKMFEEASVFNEIFKDINHNEKELCELINGEYGIGYLDALINSPIDCDKIEYLFSDAIFMKRGTSTEFFNFLRDFSEGLSINENNFLVLQKEATSCFLDLIRMRGEMYDKVYLRSGLRYLEACCKLIIRTFIVYKCTEKETFEKINNKDIFEEYYNLSDAKIDSVIEYIDSLLNVEFKEDKICELYVLEKMVEEIKNNKLISIKVKETVLKCYDLITKTNSKEQIKEIEENRILVFEINKQNVNNKINEMLKRLYLRFPGTILVDLVESKTSFSFGKREKRRRRKDGTKSATENVVIKDIKQTKGNYDNNLRCLGDSVDLVNSELNYSKHTYINIYRISDDLFAYMQAEDYILYELRKEGIINE